jgi:hypothetical protein
MEEKEEKKISTYAISGTVSSGVSCGTWVYSTHPPLRWENTKRDWDEDFVWCSTDIFYPGESRVEIGTSWPEWANYKIYPYCELVFTRKEDSQV